MAARACSPVSVLSEDQEAKSTPLFTSPNRFCVSPQQPSGNVSLQGEECESAFQDRFPPHLRAEPQTRVREKEDE